MPELPEVETVRRGLAPCMEGRRITSVEVRRRDLRVPIPRDFEKWLEGQKITHLTRRAKYLLAHLEDGTVLVVHLGMSGKLLYSAAYSNDRATHDHVILRFDDGGEVVFNDARRFGLMALVRDEGLETHKLFAGLGPEPLEREFFGAYLKSRCDEKSVAIKLLIMDQRVVVGVGNIYASEALFRAGIHPAKAAGKLTKPQCDALATAIKEVLKAAIVAGGSTLRDFVRSSGDAGYFQHQFQVYGREKEPCTACRSPIKRITQGGRSTFFCPKCQK